MHTRTPITVLPILLAISSAALSLPAAPSPAPILPGDVWFVDASGAGDFINIQAAINAASQGDTILVRAGSYPGFNLDNDALELAADSAQPPRVTGFVRIGNLGSGRHVSLSGLNLRAGFEVDACQGTVLFSDCTVVEPGLNTFIGDTSGLHRVKDSDDVVFTDSTLAGRRGGMQHFCGDVWDGADGENGLWVSGSTVTLYSTGVTGGLGGESQDGACLAMCVPAYPSDGGHGLAAVAGSLIYVDATHPTGGLRGDHWDCDGSWNGFDGEDIQTDVSSTLLVAGDPVLHVEAPSVVREDDPLPLRVSGPAGAKAWLISSPTPDWRYLGVDLGILHLKSNQLSFVFLGQIPSGNELNTSITPPPVPLGEEALRLYVQPFALYSGARLLGNVRDLAVIDETL